MKNIFNQLALPLKISCVLVAVVLIYISALHLPWSYDEYGALVSHLELDNSKFKHEYQIIQYSICDKCVNTSFFQNILLPIFVVPIRWTYALGISPILGFSRWISLDWTLLKPILLFPNIILTFFGLLLTLRSVASRGVSSIGQLAFLALIFSSAPFVWWINTFTSYSNHMICFGLLLHSSLIESNRSHETIFARAAFMRTAAMVLNYQWIPVVAFLGAIDLFRNSKLFFASGRWKSWIIPAITGFLSIIFLVLRARFSGKHGSPTTSALTDQQILLYDFPHNATSIVDALQMFASRYIEILASYYVKPSGEYLVLGADTSVLVLLFFLGLMVISLRNIDNRLYVVLFAMITPTVFLHLIGAIPMSPFRHQLVLFPPLCLLIACILDRVLICKGSRRVWMFSTIFVLIISLSVQVNDSLNTQSEMPTNEFREIIRNNDVERLVLAPCDLEPMLYADLRERYKPIYRCGPRVIELLPADVETIAVWSSFQPLTEHEALLILRYYSDADWSFRGVLRSSPAGRQGYSLMVGRKI